MPNHTGQLLTVTGSQAEIDRLIALVSTANSRLDHYTFFPMPEELINTRSPVDITPDDRYEQAKAKYESEVADWEAKGKVDFMRPHPPMTRAMVDALVTKYGASNWYDWALQNWGTKWGIYETGEWDVGNERASITFQSAWSSAVHMIAKLSLLFPTLAFELEAADEGGGFVTVYQIKDGEAIEEDLEWDSPRGIEVREHVGYGPSEYEEDSE